MLFLQRIIAVSIFLISISPVAYADFKPDVKTVTVGDVKLAYYVRGQGKPLLMINGFLSTMSLWDPALIEALSKNYQLILFDNRGVGLSTDTEQNNTTIQQMADDAAGLIKTLGYDKVNIVAWSMGARIGQQLLIRHADLIAKAVLCSPNPGGSHQDKTAADTEGKLNNPKIPEMDKIGLVFSDTPQGKLQAQQCLARIKRAVDAGIMPNDFAVSQETTKRQVRARTVLWNSSNDNFNALKNIKVPVLLADGRDDIIDMPRNVQIIANQIPYSWTAYLPGGHAFLFQSYEQFADLVFAFVQ